MVTCYLPTVAADLKTILMVYQEVRLLYSIDQCLETPVKEILQTRSLEDQLAMSVMQKQIYDLYLLPWFQADSLEMLNTYSQA